MVSTGPEDPVAVVAGLRRNLDALQSLANERGGMEEALKVRGVRDVLVQGRGPELLLSRMYI